MITGMQVLVFLLEIVYKHQLWSLKIHSSYRFYDSLYAEANFFMPPKVDSQSLSESTSGGKLVSQSCFPSNFLWLLHDFHSIKTLMSEPIFQI